MNGVDYDPLFYLPHIGVITPCVLIAAFGLSCPLYACMRGTVPMVDPERFSPFWLLVSTLLMPLGFFYYVSGQMGQVSWYAGIGGSLGVGCIMSGVTWLLLRRRIEPNAFNPVMLGKSGTVDFCALTYCVLGMIAAALWVAFIGNELVGAISLVAIEVGVPLSLLGMTCLAWGNSMGDFANNIAMAKRGVPEMSITAVFAAHIMNLLISSGLGFLLLLQKSYTSVTATIHVAMPPEIVMGLAMLCVYHSALMILAVRSNWTFPARAVVILARVSYAAFLVMAIVLSVLYDRP